MMNLEEALTITGAGHLAGPSLTGFDAHWHEHEYEFHFLPKADCHFNNGHTQHRLPNHSLTFSSPKIPHSVTLSQPGRSVAWYFFRFSVAGPVPDILRKVETAFSKRGFITLDSSYEALFRELLVKIESKNFFVKTSGKYLFMSFLSEIAMLAEIAGFTRLKMKYVDDLIQIMMANIGGGISLDAVARELNLNKSYLIRVFKQKMGTSPIKYFNKLKVDSASHLLMQSTLPIREIAERLGFCDEFYFSRIFRQYKKMSPRSFRNRDR